MSKTVFIVICTNMFALAMSANISTTVMGSEDNRSMTSAFNQDKKVDIIYNLDMDMIMNDCNESFSIEMSYLESLNESGSFVDETEKKPKCFIRCMLMNMDVVSKDGVFNPARAALIFAGERNGKPMEYIADMTAICAVRNERCLCDRSYQFMKCLMSKEIEEYGPTSQ